MIQSSLSRPLLLLQSDGGWSTNLQRATDLQVNSPPCANSEQEQEEMLVPWQREVRLRGSRLWPMEKQRPRDCSQENVTSPPPSDESVETLPHQLEPLGGIKPPAQNMDANRSYVVGFFVGKLSEACRDAGRRLRGTRDVIRSVGAADVKLLVSQYIKTKELQLLPEPPVPAEHKVRLVNPSGDVSLDLLHSSSSSAPQWPGGSVWRSGCPEVFHQRLVELPPPMSRLKSFCAQRLRDELDPLLPRTEFGDFVRIFWLKTASGLQPVSTPGCLLLLEKDAVVVSAAADDTLVVSHRFNLLEISDIQVGLAGQHVRLTGRGEKNVLVAFTYSGELSQELCKSFLKVLTPQRFPELERHPLLSGDLMLLSLDWSSSVPDVALDHGLHLTSRFQRVLADLLYLVHGNMSVPGRPLLADVRPLLYTGVRVKSSSVLQLLLTDTHVALLQEDAALQPAPQHSGLVLRHRSDVRCLMVRRSDGCLLLDVLFHSRDSSDPQGDSWRLEFSSTSDAVTFVRHMCV